MSTVDQFAPSDRDKKIRQQSTKILNYFTIGQLKKLYPFIDWSRLLSQVVGVAVSDDTDTVVHYPEVLTQVQEMVNNSDQRIVHNSILMLVVRDLALELYKVPPGMDKWTFCIQATKGGFGEVLSGLYLQHFTPHQLDNYRSKVHITSIINCNCIIRLIELLI